MTRLTVKDIDGLDQGFSAYDRELIEKTGMTLGEIACFSAGISPQEFQEAGEDYRVAVVPITAGEGIIGGFAQSVQGIVASLGFQVSVTRETDVDGIFEAVSSGSEIIFMADDVRFIAINLHNKRIADNGEATGRGYVAALNGMAKDLNGCEVLVLGFGQVGSPAVEFLLELGAKPAVYDIDEEKLHHIDKNKVQVEKDLRAALPKYHYLIDATPENSFIAPELLDGKAKIAAPGIPLGLTPEAYGKFKGATIHDPLQIGVAAMLALAVKP
ncbi:3-methylornithyl-N6-L-lysine dehydrogenase PylD [Candidatus Formimonas warabiya]|uniref:3-methylornithyl-N6-L-lysine dehydrogenase PylD n=1 Tax=Formimonas warabiya TaxID=1761012 RepID=A0A3G1KXW9_FORW1|nr:3-methylornithyl-N6-L-lysine dehydrogenase PylD [Candidatus Formimonas warabiya]ATW27247.1 3-methylornithyl-N6-L-lysine dehydrogenase PylD [Candidatus Formimonas warabiya]